MRASYFSKDILDFLILLHKHSVRYLIVGGEAVIYYGFARLTGDIDLFYENSEENTKNLYNGLNEFWGGDIPGIERIDDLLEPGMIIQFGVPPNRIDLLNRMTNVDFRKAWQNKKIERIKTKRGKFEIHYIGLADLIKNKEALKRPKDQEDLQYLKAGRKD